MRSLGKNLAASPRGEALLAAVARGEAVPEKELPRLDAKARKPSGLGPTVELLKVLLRPNCDDQDVAPRLVASSADIDAIAADDNADVAALRGWRHDIFGADALDLKHGRLSLAIENRKIKRIRLKNDS